MGLVMQLKVYTVGLIVSAQGLTEDQQRWLSKTLRWIVKAIDGGKVVLMVPGITTAKSSHYGLPSSLTNRPLPPNVSMQLLPGIGGVTRAMATEHRAAQVHDLDEVWCMPGYRQTNRLSKTRPAMSFWYGVGGQRGNIYKWVPPWVDAHETVYQPKKKELPWRTK